MNDTDARRRNHWVSHIARHAHEKPGELYLRFEGGSVTWAQIHERVGGLAAALRERGVRAGDRVAIMMTNRPEFLEMMFAANAIGAIVVPVNFRLAPDEIAYILTDSGASLLVVEEATATAAASARAACAHEIGFVSTARAEGADPYFPAVSGPAEPPVVDVPEDSPALIMYTSGTTGRPKGAVLTHQNLMCQSLTLIRVWRLFADEEVNLCASPLFQASCHQRCAAFQSWPVSASRRLSAAGSAPSTSRILVRLEAPATRVTARRRRPNATATAASAASVAWPSTARAPTRTTSAPPRSPPTPGRVEPGFTQTAIRTTPVCRAPLP